MTEHEYRQAEGVNKSTLWILRESAARYKYCLDNPPEDTAAFRFGRAVHAAILTPSAYKRDFVVAPEINRRTNAGKEEYAAFLESAAGKEIISAEEAETVSAIVKTFRKNPEAMQLLKGTKREKPIFWTSDSGIKCKCRIDAFKAGIMLDIKTAQCAETDCFTKESIRYGYHVQAAHYIDAYYKTVSSKTPEWYFIVIEKTPPYAMNILKADPGFLDYGFIIREELLSKLKKCRETGIYPDYGKNDLCLPAYIAGVI